MRDARRGVPRGKNKAADSQNRDQPDPLSDWTASITSLGESFCNCNISMLIGKMKGLSVWAECVRISQSQAVCIAFVDDAEQDLLTQQRFRFCKLLHEFDNALLYLSFVLNEEDIGGTLEQTLYLIAILTHHRRNERSFFGRPF